MPKRKPDSKRAIETQPRVKLTPALVDEFLLWLTNGGTVLGFCKQPGRASPRAWYNWIHRDAELREKFEAACRIGYDVIAQQALDIADTPQPGEIRTVEDGPEGTSEKTVTEDMLGHRKLQVWTRLQLLAKWDHHRYGDRSKVEHEGGMSLQVVTGVPREGDES